MLEEESDCYRLTLNNYTLLSYKAMGEAVAACGAYLWYFWD